MSPFPIPASVQTLPLRQARLAFERAYLVDQLNRHEGNISRAAAFVGMERAALHRKLRNIGLRRAARAAAFVETKAPK